MPSRRQRRKAKERRRQRVSPARPGRRKQSVLYARPADRVELLTYTRRQAAEALGVSLSTIDRRVVPAIDTFFNDWGMRLIPVDELKRYVAERTAPARARQRPPGRPGRPRTVPAEVIGRIRREHSQGQSLAQIARELNSDGSQTGQGGRQWWPSTVLAVLRRA
jgi:DNA invertase Pin-like site-specific DNA recombinase